MSDPAVNSRAVNGRVGALGHKRAFGVNSGGRATSERYFPNLAGSLSALIVAAKSLENTRKTPSPADPTGARAC
jgi:hypothetical protein